MLCNLEIMSVLFWFPCNSMRDALHSKILSLARCKYFAFPNPYLRIRMLCTLLYVLGFVTAMSIQLGPSHPSLNILQLPSSILKSVHCISKTIFWYLTKYSLLCLNSSILANRRFAHTTGTYVPCSSYTHLEYNDMAHNSHCCCHVTLSAGSRHHTSAVLFVVILLLFDCQLILPLPQLFALVTATATTTAMFVGLPTCPQRW